MSPEREYYFRGAAICQTAQRMFQNLSSKLDDIELLKDTDVRQKWVTKAIEGLNGKTYRVWALGRPTDHREFSDLQRLEQRTHTLSYRPLNIDHMLSEGRRLEYPTNCTLEMYYTHSLEKYYGCGIVAGSIYITNKGTIDRIESEEIQHLSVEFAKDEKRKFAAFSGLALVSSRQKPADHYTMIFAN